MGAVAPRETGWEGLQLKSMQSLKAVVKNGRLVMDEPTELPEGTELVVRIVADSGDVKDDELVRLHLSPEDQAHLRAGIDAAERGETRPLTPEELDHWAETGELLPSF